MKLSGFAFLKLKTLFFMRGILVLFFNLALMRQNLDRIVLPKHYDLYVAVEEEIFNGTVTMHLTATEEVSTFRFNASELELSKLEVEQDNNIVSSNFTSENEFVTVALTSRIIGDFSLKVDYAGKFTPRLNGFYKSKYNGKNLYSTHFEPSDARKAFPCFDQPDLKATYSIKIKAPEGNIALSNNKLEKVEDNVFTFEKTVKMSTYIVAWVVGDLKYIEDTSTGIPIRVYADEPEIEWGAFSLKIATRTLKFYEDYFKIKYPFPKLDLVAIPAFAMGAMENWGLVTFRKTSLLYNNKSTSMQAKKGIAITVSHEIAHMWFGNLVTMEWWDDLWLNEGFATWAATKAIDESCQDVLRWDPWTAFINDDMVPGMAMDSLNSTHKIETEVNYPAEIEQIFDAISYSKGSSIIRMTETWIGADKFKEGLRLYVNKYQYANTITRNLWECLSIASNKDVAGIIEPWTSREGFPYIIVKDLGKQLELTQKRFSMGHNKESEPMPIPINIKWENEETVILMKDKTMTINKISEFYKLNNMVSGFYRVLYPDTHLNALLSKYQVKMENENMLNLFSDQFAMIVSLRAHLSSILPHLSILAKEENYEVMLSGISGLLTLRSAFYYDQKIVNYFNKVLLKLIARVDNIDLQNAGSDVNSISLNSYLVAVAVRAGHQKTIERLKSMSIANLDPEFHRSYFIAIVDSKFDEVMQVYMESTKPGEKEAALFAIGTTSEEKYINQIFENLNQIEPHASIRLFAALGQNLKLRNKIASLFISNFKDIKAHIGDSNLVRHSIEFVLDPVVQEGEIEKVYSFLESIKNEDELKSSVGKCHDSLNILTMLRKEYQNYSFE